VTRRRLCETCHLWQPRDASRDVGECRANPPTVQIVQLRSSSLSDAVAAKPVGVFPPTHSTTWCGSWVEADDTEGSA
jgi:hypothetical protein